MSWPHAVPIRYGKFLYLRLLGGNFGVCALRSGRGARAVALQILLILLAGGFAGFALPSAIAAPRPAAPDLSRTLAAMTLAQSHHPAAVTARAEADLDGDGIPDRAELSRRRLEIVIHLSGAPSRHVPLLEPVVALAAVDLDLDGDRDLVAVTQVPRVFIWVNNGSGKFNLRADVRSRLLSSLVQTVSDPLSFPPSPALQFAASSAVGTVRGRSILTRIAPKPVRLVSSSASPRAPPSSLLG